MKKILSERIENRIVKDSKDCWNWLGMKDRDGYGRMCYKGKQGQLVHRLSYSFYKEPIPEGLLVLHSCDNPSCVNPAHLRLGTNQDNQKDKKDRQRIVGSKHPYSKLTEEDVISIRASSLSQEKLGKLYGVEQAHIGRIIRRVNWTHI